MKILTVEVDAVAVNCRVSNAEIIETTKFDMPEKALISLVAETAVLNVRESIAARTNVPYTAIAVKKLSIKNIHIREE
ncbi:MAG TPA: hypothetical protein DCZ94_21675 [Lentisphaeria bacterium]|nr:MAG: hypothetical protein A2X48_14605 [Lentisphaerae bacterium GWF2_49_21]HBC89556.1 hypothetical protein [Lentisphaeria bacterium]